MEYQNSGNKIFVDSARQVRRAIFPWWVFVAVPLVAMLLQIYLPLFETLRFVQKLELPLLITIYFSVMRRSQIRGLFIGMALGLAQDSFARHGFPIGMYGICKTLVGYLSASIGMQFDVEHAFVRLLLCFVFYVFHQFLYWVMQRALLDQMVIFDLRGELILGLINAILGVAIFHFLDKLREPE